MTAVTVATSEQSNVVSEPHYHQTVPNTLTNATRTICQPS
jgi:hypothetical protein